MNVSGLLLLLGSYVEKLSIHETVEGTLRGVVLGAFQVLLSHLGNPQAGDVVRPLEISCLDVPIDGLG